MSISKTIIPYATLATAFQDHRQSPWPRQPRTRTADQSQLTAVSEAAAALRNAPKVTVSGATLTVLLADDGAVGIALSGRQAVAGDLFVSATTADVTSGALATAKGSAVAAGDLWKVASASTVTYIGGAVSALGHGPAAVHLSRLQP